MTEETTTEPGATPPVPAPVADAPTSAGDTPAATGSPPEGGGESFVPFYQALPETWRDDMVKGLELGDAEANVLGRYTDFPSFGKAFFEQHKKIRQGLASSPSLPENATEDQIAEYRQAIGVPAEASAYRDTLPEGLVLAEEDERILDEVWQAAHQENLPPQALARIHASFFAAREAENARIMDQHGMDKQQCTQVLRDNWGSDTETNLNAIRGMLATISEEDRELLEQAELPDGRKLFNAPTLVQWFANTAKTLNPAATVVPNTANPAQAIDTEIKKIEDMMANDPDAYWKDETIQRRYEQLLEAQSNMKAA